jgi:hypothetical protein
MLRNTYQQGVEGSGGGLYGVGVFGSGNLVALYAATPA